MLRARADRARAGWRAAVGQKPGRDQVDARLAEPRGDIDAARAFEDFARRSDLDQPALVQDADAVRHRHRFDLVMGDVEDGGAEILLDVLQLQAACRRGAWRRERKAARPSDRRRGGARARGRSPRAASRRRKAAWRGSQACSRCRGSRRPSPRAP